MAKTFPTCDKLVDYNNAVAGHDGLLSDVSGELFIKPSTPAEIAFYETSALHPEFMKIMPTYLGTLDLDEKMPKSIDLSASSLVLEKGSELPTERNTATFTNTSKQTDKQQPESEDSTISFEPNQRILGRRITTDCAVVLDNACYGFRRPNILDVKLGVRLWADDAPEAKRARLQKIAADSTHKDLGFRIAGMRVWQGADAKGKDINEQGYKIYGKSYGRDIVNRDNVNDSFQCFIDGERTGTSKDLGKYILQAFLEDVLQIQSKFESHENRMFSASLLFVYEGDGEALRTALQEKKQLQPVDEIFEDTNDETKSAQISSIKLIDFAHAEWTPGQGPDENTLTGIRSIVKILKNLRST